MRLFRRTSGQVVTALCSTSLFQSISDDVMVVFVSRVSRIARTIQSCIRFVSPSHLFDMLGGPSIRLSDISTRGRSTPPSIRSNASASTSRTRVSPISARLKHAFQHRWVAWIPPKLAWNSLKPVIRSSVAVRDSIDTANDSCGCAGYYSWSLSRRSLSDMPLFSY